MLQASALIVQDQTIQEAWRLLREKLGWSNVMTSKCLHFAAHSLDNAINPPVALDNGVVINKVWPAFRQAVEMQMLTSNTPQPARWDDGSWAAYNRYMTAIHCWAAQKGWSTTEVENTLFAVYK